jgi:hypothetical protein
MARKAKFKSNEQVTYSNDTGECSLFIDNKGQYVYRNKPVVNLRNASGDLIAKAISVAHVQRLPESVPCTVLTDTAAGTDRDVSINLPCDVPTSKVDLTLDERGARYGDFTDHARLAQQLQDVMRNHTITIPGSNSESFKPWDNLTPVMKQALTVDADKTARILNGDPTYIDNWHDKQGYAKLVEDRLKK